MRSWFNKTTLRLFLGIVGRVSIRLLGDNMPLIHFLKGYGEEFSYLRRYMWRYLRISNLGLSSSAKKLDNKYGNINNCSFW